MDTKEIFKNISEMLEKFGIKEALKNPQVVETIYDVMSKHGMKVDKNLFNIVVMGFAVTPTDKLGDLVGMITGLMSGAAGATGAGGQGQGSAANPLGAILGALGGAAAQQPAQSQTAAQGQEANPLAAFAALAGALGGATQAQPQQQTQSQAANNPTAALLGGLLNAVAQQKK